MSRVLSRRSAQVALAFVYQNIVPVITTSLEGDVKKIRTAVAIGLAIPLLMFIGWEAAILGCISPGAPPCTIGNITLLTKERWLC